MTIAAAIFLDIITFCKAWTKRGKPKRDIDFALVMPSLQRLLCYLGRLISYSATYAEEDLSIISTTCWSSKSGKR